MNIPSLIVGAIVLGMLVSIIVWQIRGRRQGKSVCSCGCGCSGCAMSGSCHAKK